MNRNIPADDKKGIFFHATEDQPVFENKTSFQDMVEEIKLLKNKNTIISQTMFDLSQFVMPNDRDDWNGIFIESYEAEKDSDNTSIMENPEDSSYTGESDNTSIMENPEDSSYTEENAC